jgi:hypothetical protein
LASTGLAAASSILTGFSALQQSRYQAAVLSQQMEVEQKNVANINQAAQTEAMEADQDAAAFMAEDQVRLAASGFSLGSPSYLRRIARNRLVAQENSRRILDDGARAVESTQNRIAGLQSEKSGLKKSAGFTLLSTGLALTNDWLSGANLVSENAARRTNTTASGVRT